MVKKFLLSVALLTLVAQPAAAAGETVTTLDDQQSVAVTIYNQNRALVKDHRRIDLPPGRNVLAFKEVSAKMEPETALLKAPALKVLEQNFEFDLLTPQSLLEKYLGKEVRVVTRHPTTGEETSTPATVLSTNSGVVLKSGNHIETGVPGRLIFPDVPPDLRDQPTLTMLIDNQGRGPRDVELSYLTTGLDWQADYVAELNASDTGCDIRGWVTLNNKSGATFQNARLQLVAGDVKQVGREGHRVRAMMAKGLAMEADAEMAEEQMFEYHLYTLDRPTTIKDNQTKQVALLSGTDVSIRKEYVLTGYDYLYLSHYGRIGQKMKIGVFVETKNSKGNHLGIPFPKGVVRVYKKDSQGNLQFVGEDRIDHTPENELIRLKLGDAFDVTADKVQTDFKKLGGFSPYNYVYEVGFQIVLKNAKKEPVMVSVVEPIPGDWEMLSESLRHEKKASNTAVWTVPVPAKGENTLTYRVRVKQ